MSLAEQLGYEQTPANALQRAFRRFAWSRPGAWILSKTGRYVDRAIDKVRPGALLRNGSPTATFR